MYRCWPAASSEQGQDGTKTQQGEWAVKIVPLTQRRIRLLVQHEKACLQALRGQPHVLQLHSVIWTRHKAFLIME